MRNPFRAAAAVLLALGVAVPMHAQDAPQYVEVGHYDLPPADVEMFLEQVKTVRDAAMEIGLDDRFAWDTYRWDNTVYFVSWHESLINLEDPEAMFQAFQGTPVQDRVMAAFERAGSVGFVSGMNEISRERPDLGYIPAEPAVTPGQHAGVYVIRQWPKGDPAAFEESVKDFMGMMTELGGVYPVFLSQNMVGRGGYTFAVPFESPANFYGQNSLEGMIQQAGMSEQWEEAGSAHDQLINRSESMLVWYLPEHSYRPEGME